MDEEVVDAHVVQVIGDPGGTVELGRDVVKTLHPVPPQSRPESSVSTPCRNAKSAAAGAFQQPAERLWLVREHPCVGAAIARDQFAEAVRVDHRLVSEQGKADSRVELQVMPCDARANLEAVE